MIPHKVFLPAVGAAATLALSLVLLLAQVATFWAAAITVGATLLAVLLAERLVHVADAFLDWTFDARSIAFRLVAAAVIANGAVATALVIAGLSAVPLALLGLTALACLQALVGLVASAYLSRVRPRLQAHAVELERRAIPRDETRVLAEVTSTADDPMEKHDVRVMRLALRRVKLGWLVIRGSEPLTDGETPFGIRFEVQITAEAMANPKRRTLPTEVAEPIAVALSELLNQELETRNVGVQRLRRSGGYTITVTIQDVMARIYPFVDELEWASIRDPALVGYGLDAKPIHLLLRQHGQFLGKTRSGKSSLINCVLAYLTRCWDAVVWVCGTEKLYDMLAGWLEIYLDADEEMPLNWVMAGPDDTAEMLAALMRVARYRQSLRLHERVNLPDIVLVLDEASFALRNTTVTANFDGREHTMSALCGMITQGAGSAGCWLEYSTQRDTNDQLGPAGGDIQAQTGFTAAFGTQDNLSLGRQLGDFKLPPPAHKGEFYLKDDAGEPYPTLTKGRYVQEDDPSKPLVHDGPKVSEVAWERRRFRTELDAGSQRAAGDAYRLRPTRVTERFLSYLASPTSVAAPWNHGASDADPERREIDGAVATLTRVPDAVEREAIDLARHLGEDYSTLPPAQREAYRNVVTELLATGGREPTAPIEGSLTEQVTYVLRRANRGLTSREIVDGMRAAGLEPRSEGSVRNLLGKLTEDGVLTRDDRAFTLNDGN